MGFPEKFGQVSMLFLAAKLSFEVSRYGKIAISLAFAALLNGCGSSAPLATSSTSSTSKYWIMAENVHAYILGNLLTSNNSYAITPGSDTAYTWYNASQIGADAAMDMEGDSRFAPYMNSTYSWMNHVWDSSSSIGGYFASANVIGSGSGGAKYVDDNSLAGIAYLDAYETTTGSQQTAYLVSAEAIANWLMYSGLWDSTFGGGFWWSTDKTVKPTQSNGLALQLFLRLYKITRNPTYSSWATSIKSWLESTMYRPNGLYIWEIESNGTVQTANFTYDNAIMMEADLLWASVMGDNSYVAKAESIATALNAVLWNSSTHVYPIATNSPFVNPTWSVWSSEALIRLYQADGNTNWLNYAQENIDFMNTYLRDGANSGYYFMCNPDGTNPTTNNFQGVDQAWMERTQALLALYR